MQTTLNKIGTASFWDVVDNVYFNLPKDFLIYNRSNKVWTGGSKDGQFYLQLEKMNTGDGKIPNILADGDLNIFLTSVDSVENFSAKKRGIKVAGSIGTKSIEGYLLMIDCSNNTSYLILLATSTNRLAHNAKPHALAVGNQLIKSLIIGV